MIEFKTSQERDSEARERRDAANRAQYVHHLLTTIGRQLMLPPAKNAAELRALHPLGDPEPVDFNNLPQCRFCDCFGNPCLCDRDYVAMLPDPWFVMNKVRRYQDSRRAHAALLSIGRRYGDGSILYNDRFNFNEGVAVVRTLEEYGLEIREIHSGFEVLEIVGLR